MSGVIGAQAFFARLINAMDRDPHEALQANGTLTRQETKAKLIEFLVKGIENGYTDVLADLKDLDHGGANYVTAQATISARRAAAAVIDEDERSMLSEIYDDEPMPEECSSVAREITDAAGAGDLLRTKTILAESPWAINERDITGSTAIVRAAMASRFDVAKSLIETDGFTASINNYRQQNVLHFLPNFSDEEAVSILPALFHSGADFDQEASYIERGWDSAPQLTPRIRGCPLMQTVLYDRVVLLRALLEQIHNVEGGRQNCRLCESGSRYRKIISIAIMMRRASLIETILEHRKAHGAADTTDMRKIEVWYNQELSQAWQLVINGPAALADLPESFTRAIIYGPSADKVLRNTLALIWQDDAEYIRKCALTQLSQAVVANSLQAVQDILDEARRGGLQDVWWCTQSDSWDSPLMLSIRLGFRDIFDVLWPVGKAFICVERERKCGLSRCIDCRRPFDYSNASGMCAFFLLWWWRRRTHKANLVHVALSFAVIAAHQDHYFA
jgi:hypothetical protein